MSRDCWFKNANGRALAVGANKMSRKAWAYFSRRHFFDRWPMEMRAETAAQFVDEPSVAAFLRKSRKGVYSQPLDNQGASPNGTVSNLSRI
jgi:hypothetical protein